MGQSAVHQRMAEPTDTPPAPAADALDTPAFEVMACAGPKTGLVFASAHSGRHYPQDMGTVAPLETVRTTEDAHVDLLIAGAEAMGADVIVCHTGRAYVDLNRNAADLDPALIRDCPVPEGSAKALAGYGVIHRQSGNGLPLYGHRLDMAAVQARLDRVHRPYHQALGGLMHKAKAQTGRAVLVDWHSMPQRATGRGGPDIVLGDRFGSSCDAVWTRRVRSLFEAEGWRVGLNRPYAGGYATQIWGRPDEGFHALQIEINRALYWNEAKHQPSEGWKRCAGVIRRVMTRLCQQAAQDLGHP